MSFNFSLHGAIGAFAIDVAIDLDKGVTGLVGRSGAGKTSLLRCLAGFEHVPGAIRVNDAVWQDTTQLVPPNRRGIGYVAQGAPLLPHLTLRQTLSYAAKRRPPAMLIEEAIARTGSEALLDRSTVKLSGGERQRAALCIALISARSLLLLDEPLSALDGEARAELRAMLAAVLPTLPVPTIFVSHDHAEIDQIAPRRIEIRDGRASN